ncbi:MAG: hypothetical protein ACLTSZ_07260 [Lachnospiraceae bacterium]
MMLPGMGGAQMKQIEDAIDEKQMARIEAMILSMTRRSVRIRTSLNPSRKRRIADGARRGHQRGEQAGEAVWNRAGR